MKRSFGITALFVLLVAALMAFTEKQPRYKNLKVLPKDISEKDMDSVMHHFSASLGVRCNYCHVRNDSTKTINFASDDLKPKLIAREMMRMTTAINEKYFNVTGKIDLHSTLLVTCYTCHRGSQDPAVQPPPRQPRPASTGDSTKTHMMTDSTRH